MDWELLQIMVFVVVLVSIAGGVVTSIVERVISYKKSQLRANQPTHPDPDVSRLVSATEQLEDRVRVLERIATERNDANDILAAEIESLRALPDAKPRENAA